MIFARPAGHIQSNFADDRLPGHEIDSVDSRQIHAINSLELVGSLLDGRLDRAVEKPGRYLRKNPFWIGISKPIRYPTVFPRTLVRVSFWSA